MSEEETIRRLKKIDYNEMQYFVFQWVNDHTDKRTIENILELHFWNRDEWDTEKRKHTKATK